MNSLLIRFSPLTATMTQKKGYLLEIFHLLLEKEEAALVNLIVRDTMNVSVSAMKILTEILKECEKFIVHKISHLHYASIVNIVLCM